MSRLALFHGTANWFLPGAKVDPSWHGLLGVTPKRVLGRNIQPAAWGSTSLEGAARYSAAKGKRSAQPPLFSPVYEVEPTSPKEDLKRINWDTGESYVGDPHGMTVKRLAGYADYNGEVM
jgi:hypothetical protein